MAYVGAAVGVAQLGLTAYNTFAGDDGPSQKALGGFDMFRSTSPSGGVQVAETTPGLLSSTFLPGGGYMELRRRGEGIPGEFANLRSEVRPAFGRITEAAVTAIRNAESRAKGDLKDQLSRRRVLGSSFGSDALIRLEREFGEAEFKTRAQATLAEIATSAQLIQQEFKAILGNLESEMKEIFGTAKIGTALLTGSNTAMAQFQKAAMEEAKGRGQGAASLFGQSQDLIDQFDALGGAGGAGTAGSSFNTGTGAVVAA